MLNTPLFARVYLSIDLDRAHSHMRAWCGSTMCIGGRCIQLSRPDLDLRRMSALKLGRVLAGKKISRYDVPIIIRATAAEAFVISKWQAECLFNFTGWSHFWPNWLGIWRTGADAPAMLTAMERFIEHYYPEQIAAFRREVERLRAVKDLCTTECVEA